MYFDFIEKRIYTDANNLNSNLFFKKWNGSVTHKIGRERNTTPGTRGSSLHRLPYLNQEFHVMSQKRERQHHNKGAEESSTTQSRKRQTAPRRRRRRGTSPKRRDERAAPPMRSGTTPKTDWIEREERSDHPKEGVRTATLLQLLYLALVWFNFDLI